MTFQPLTFPASSSRNNLIVLRVGPHKLGLIFQTFPYKVLDFAFFSQLTHLLHGSPVDSVQFRIPKKMRCTAEWPDRCSVSSNSDIKRESAVLSGRYSVRRDVVFLPTILMLEEH